MARADLQVLQRVRHVTDVAPVVPMAASTAPRVESVMRHVHWSTRSFVAAAVAACIAVLAAPVRQAAAQQPASPAPGSIPNIGGGDKTPPVVIIAPGTGTDTVARLPVSITWCDNLSLDAPSKHITIDGANVTSSFSYQTITKIGCGAAAVSNGTVTLRPGTSDTLTASIVDNALNLGTSTVVYTYTSPPPPPLAPRYSVEVTPDSDFYVYAPGGQSGVTFFIRNTGSVTTTFGDSVTCTNIVGTMFQSACAILPSSASIAPNAVDTVIAAWTSGASGSQGRIRVKAYQTSPAGTATDTGWVIVAAHALSARAPVVDVAAENPGPTARRDLCLTIDAGEDAASECGDLRIDHPLPGVRTMNAAHTPVLLYNSQFAHPHPVIAANVTLSDSTLPPDTMLSILTVDGVARDTVRWKGSMFGAGETRRVVLSYDAIADSIKVNSYTVTVTSIYNSPSERYTAAPASGTLLLINRAASPFGAGWWLAGLEQLYFPPGDSTILWVGGDGSATLYSKSTVANTWTGPNVDRPDTLKWDGTNYIRYLRHGLQVKFNSAGQHVQTVNRLKHVTTFTYTGALLTGIHLPTPAGGASISYGLSYTSGRLTVTSPGPHTTSRTSTVYLSKAKVDSIFDPDLTETTGYTIHFGYTGSDSTRITSRSNERRISTYYFYDAASKFTRDSLTVSHAASIVDRFRNVDSLGLAATPTAVSPESAYVQINGPRKDTTVTTFWLDRFGAPRRIMNAVRATTVLTRNDTRWPAAVTRVLSANGRVLLAGYNTRGTEDSVVDSATIVSGKPAVTKFKWDSRWDFADTIIAPAGETTTMLYDTVGNREWQQIGPSSTRRVTFTYDPSTFLLRTVKAPLTSGPDSVAYDSQLGDLSHTATPYRYATNSYVDGVGRDTLVKTQIDSAGLKWLWQRYTYDDADRELTASTSGGRTSLQEGNSQIEGFVDSSTVTVTNAYDSAGNLLSVTRQTVPDSNKIGAVVTKWTYDEANRHTKEIAPDSKADSMAYDAAGNVVSWTTRRGGPPIVTTYDALNRRLQHFVPPVFYPETTLVDSFTVATFTLMYPDTVYTHSLGLSIPGDWATYTYDIAGNLTGAVNGDAVVRRTYNTNGTLRTDSLRIRTYADLDNGGDTTSHRYGQTFGYDIAGRRIWMHVDSVLAPRVSGVVKDTIHYAYDSITGALTTITDVMGSTWRYAYDAGGRIDSTYFPGSGLEVQTFDGEGRDSTRVDRLTSVVDTINNDLLFHDARDHIVQVHTPFDTTAFRYTPLGAVAVTAEQNQEGGHENQQFNMDALGNMFEELSDFFEFGSLHKYVYEPNTGRLRAIRAPVIGTAVIFDTSTYDPAGNRHWQIKYDLWAPGWSYTPPSAQEFSFNYYAADNTLRLVDRNECYLQTQTQANCTPDPSGNFAGAYEEYRYDALGRRILVRTRRDQWCGSTTGCYHTMTRTIWDGDQVLFEVRVPAWSSVSADTLEADTVFIGGQYSAYGPYGRVLYTHGLGLDAPLGVVRLGYSFGDGATNWNGPQDLVLYRNWRGIPNAGTWTDGTTTLHCSNLHASLCVLIRYPATSTTTYFVPATSEPDSGWFGTITTQDPDGSGELYKRNRYYDPSQGRFTQEDPIGLAGGLNAYGFANGDPISYSDPFGLCPYTASENPLVSLQCALEDLIGAVRFGPGIIAQNVASDPTKGQFLVALASVPLAAAGGEEADATKVVVKGLSEVEEAESSLGNMLRELESHDHFEAARLEGKGVQTRGDHRQELTDFANGLRTSAIRLKKILSQGQLDPQLRARVESLLGRVSKLRDRINSTLRQ